MARIIQAPNGITYDLSRQSDDDLIHLRRMARQELDFKAARIIQEEMAERKEKYHMSISSPTIIYRGKNVYLRKQTMRQLERLLNNLDPDFEDEKMALVNKEIERRQEEEQPQPQPTTTVNKYYIMTLLDATIKTVGVTFDSGAKRYTYLTRLDLKVGDLVVVPVSGDRDFTIGTVSYVDTIPEIPENSNIKYKWVIQAVDIKGYEEQLKTDETINDRIREHTRNLHRKQALESLQQISPGIENIMKDVIDVG